MGGKARGLIPREPDPGLRIADQQAYLFINCTDQPPSYSILGSVDGLPDSTCMDSGPQTMDSQWIASDPDHDPSVSEQAGAFVLDGSFHRQDSGFGTLLTKHGWTFTFSP